MKKLLKLQQKTSVSTLVEKLVFLGIRASIKRKTIVVDEADEKTVRLLIKKSTL